LTRINILKTLILLNTIRFLNFIIMNINYYNLYFIYWVYWQSLEYFWPVDIGESPSEVIQQASWFLQKGGNFGHTYL
jgi:hypothetical protein